MPERMNATGRVNSPRVSNSPPTNCRIPANQISVKRAAGFAG
jgi:hypothetical protein